MATSVGFDIYAKDRASGQFNKVGNSVERAGHQARQSGGHFKSFGKIAAGVFSGGLALQGARSIGRFFNESVKGAIEDERATKMLALQLHNSAGATKAQIAATEGWITAQGKAYGVTDNELRPALARMVAVTHSVTKARRLTSLAENISAGTGKSLATVTGALAKAQLGSLTGLSRLGVKTKEMIQVHGKAKQVTMSLHDVTKNLAKTYRGQAANSANTAAGQWGRLKVMLDETQESIGYKLLPIVTSLAKFILGRIVPAVSRWATTMRADLGPTFDRIRSVISSAQPYFDRVGKFMKDNPATVKVFAYTLGGLAVVLGVVSVATWALNAALLANPIGLVVVAIAALAAGLYYAYTHSAKFKVVVDKMGAALKWFGGAVAQVAGFVKNHWLLVGTILVGPLFFAAVQIVKHWQRIKSVVVGGVSAVIGFVKSHWQAILGGLIGGPFGIAAALVITHWGQIKSAVSSGVGRVVGYVKSLPGRILGAIGNMNSLLLHAGEAVIQGLIDGIASKIGALTSKLHAITSLIPKHKGPMDKDRQLLTPAGVAIMEGLIHGIRSRETALARVLDKVTANVKAKGDKLKGLVSSRNDFAAGFQGFSSSIFSADPGQDANGNPIASTAGGLIAFQRQQLAQANQVKGDVSTLIKRGLSKSLIKQLQAQGASGIAQIHALAQGTAADVKTANSLDKQTNSALASAGMTAGNAIYGSAISEAAKEDRQAKALARAIRHEMEGLTHKQLERLEFRLDGHVLVATLKAEKKKNGNKPLGLN